MTAHATRPDGGVLVVGRTTIPYTIRYSERARYKRIVVTPQGVEVVAPTGTLFDGRDGVAMYVHTKRRWIFDAVGAIATQQQQALTQRYASGAKVQYRGRWLMLDVRPEPVDEVVISFRSKLHVAAPEALDEAGRSAAVHVAFERWLRERADADLARLGRRFEASLGVKAAAFVLSDTKARWGSCGRDGVVRVHWRLVQAPVAAFEYVVAHEVTHLVHRNHGPDFWRTLARQLPDWADRKGMLERWEGARREV